MSEKPPRVFVTAEWLERSADHFPQAGCPGGRARFARRYPRGVELNLYNAKRWGTRCVLFASHQRTVIAASEYFEGVVHGMALNGLYRDSNYGYALWETWKRFGQTMWVGGAELPTERP